MFSVVAKHLADHLSSAENRLQAFETEAQGMRHALTGPHCAAAAKWWWKEVNTKARASEDERHTQSCIHL